MTDTQPWYVPEDYKGRQLCDECFEKFKIEFSGLIDEDHERIRDEPI
jgi:hypothetical protein